jgi:ligand-binding sensor domain-containing protein
MGLNHLMRQPKPTGEGNTLRALFKQYLSKGGQDDTFTWETLTTENGLPHNWIYDLYQGADGKIYVGTWGGGLLVIQEDNWNTYTKKDGLHSNAITAIREDHHGRVWLATDNGLNILEGEVIRDGGLIGKSLLNITIDRHKHLWAGCWRAATSGGGLYRFNGSRWESFSTRQNLPGQEILKVFEDTRGRIWVGTYEHGSGAGVGCYDGSRWTNYTVKNGLADNCVYSMFEDPSGNMWFGTTKGVSIFEGTRWHTLTVKDGLVDNRIYCMWIDSHKKMWFGTENGVSRFDGSNWLSYTQKDGLVENLVRAILETHEHDLWFGTYPYAVGKGGISIAKHDRPLSLTQRVLDLLPEPPEPGMLPSGDE